MDHAAYHIVYVDNRANDDLDGKYIHKTRFGAFDGANRENKDLWDSRSPEYVEMILPQVDEVRNNITSILSHFDGGMSYKPWEWSAPMPSLTAGEKPMPPYFCCSTLTCLVYICTSGNTCMAKLTELESIYTNFQPTLVILEASAERDNEHDRTQRTSQPLSDSLHVNKRPGLTAVSIDSDVYGLALLQRIYAEISSTKFSKLVVPIAMIPISNNDANGSNVDRHSQGSRPSHLSSGSLHRISGPTTSKSRESNNTGASVSLQQMAHCLDAGAAEVLTSPLRRNRVYDLVTHGYRAHKEACKDRAALLATTRLRKRSWVGFDDTKPYAYLREEMYVAVKRIFLMKLDPESQISDCVLTFNDRVSNLMTRICNPDYIPNTFDPRYLQFSSLII